MKARTTDDFYDIQRRQQRLTLILAAVLFLLYAAFIALAAAGVSIIANVFKGAPHVLGRGALTRALLAAGLIAFVLALFQYLDARKNGAAFILRQLGARPADLRDRYHKRFVDTVDEVRIAAGLPAVRGYVLPSLALNALAVIESDGTPAVAVTEGLLSETTRDEVLAVAAHETAHIIRGDTVFITLACSLADTFERLWNTLTPDEEQAAGALPPAAAARSGSAFLGLASGLSYVVLRVLSTLISRGREFLADAAAVELCRDPEALARIIYKARLKNTFVGDFSLTYSPLLIVPSDPLSEEEGFRGRLFSTHPPVMVRVERLAALAHKTGPDIIRRVWEIQQNRKDHQRLLESEEEYQHKFRVRTGGLEESLEPEKVWLIPNDKGQWLGPLSLSELIQNPYFLPSRRVRNVQEGVEAAASEFAVVREAARRARGGRSDRDGRGLCPRCRIPLGDYDYEGVPVRICRRCLGKLVDGRSVERILARREFKFSPELLKKAEVVRERFLTNPIKAQKRKDRECPPADCPACGYRMASRPYNYQYFLPVEKCLSCSRIWFDADELEILQILVEKARP
jgi:Zn-dependent protease with chaperone function/Zn-finger nucleic acid-binding protein